MNEDAWDRVFLWEGWAAINALLNLLMILILVIFAMRIVGLLEARKNEIVALREQIKQKDDIIDIQRQRIALEERQHGRR